MDSPTSTSPQTWAAIATAIAGAVAVVVKKRLTRRSRPSSGTRPSTLVTQSQLRSGLAANRKEILAAIGTQGTAIERRLDALESAVARLDERKKK